MHDDESKSVSDLLEGGTTIMVGSGMVGSGMVGSGMVDSGSPGRLEFRPLTVAGLDGGIQILLDTNEEWVRRLGEREQLQVTLSDDRRSNWAWMTGGFVISTDDALIDELWSPFADAYFDDGRQSAGIAVMTIEVAVGRYWSAPAGRLGQLISAAKAKFGDAEQAGEHGDIDPTP